MKTADAERFFGYVDPQKGMDHEERLAANAEALNGERCAQCGLPIAWCNERAELREMTIKALRLEKEAGHGPQAHRWG